MAFNKLAGLALSLLGGALGVWVFVKLSAIAREMRGLSPILDRDIISGLQSERTTVIVVGLIAAGLLLAGIYMMTRRDTSQ